jgi:DNA polymerase-1
MRSLYGRINYEVKGSTNKLNYPIQSTAADMTKLALVMVDGELRRRHLDAALINCVHDELLVQCRPATRDEVMAIVAGGMAEAARIVFPQMPVPVEIGHGASWAEAKAETTLWTP